MISTGALKDLPLPAVPAFAAKYKAAYKRDMNAECVLNYNMMKVLARSINISQSLDAKVVRYYPRLRNRVWSRKGYGQREA